MATGDPIMINRKLANIVKGQKLVALAERETVQQACLCMCERRTGSVLVLDDQQRLTGIFTGRDAVRTLAEGKSAQGDPAGAGDDAQSNYNHSRQSRNRRTAGDVQSRLPSSSGRRAAEGFGASSRGVISWGRRSTGWTTKTTYGNASADRQDVNT